MNKKFKLTDKVTKESIRSPEFKRWLMRILAVVCIISLIFQFSTCVYQGLNAYAVEDDSIVGTWVFNETITYSPFTTGSYHSFNIDFVTSAPLNYGNDVNTTIGFNLYNINGNLDLYYGSSQVYDFESNKWTQYTDANWNNIDILLLRTITITGGSDITNVIFKTWLKANAIKQVETVHDFTNEIRLFNDDLTFFITDQASWANVFYFDYEILGLGVCDYLSLQRTTSNEYLMRYNVVSDGADGYLHTSYRYYVAQSRGGFLKENYKTIRFITNPEDTELQQWLLDNTTLMGTVDDQETYDYIYDMGFNVGYNSGYEQGFANSLIGDSLSGPINALSSITLIQIGDTVITLGGVIMTAIALCLVLAFLKLYAGG